MGPSFFLVIIGWLLAAAGLVLGTWVGLSEVIDGNIAGGIALGLGIFLGGQFLAIIMWLIFVAVND